VDDDQRRCRRNSSFPFESRHQQITPGWLSDWRQSSPRKSRRGTSCGALGSNDGICPRKISVDGNAWWPGDGRSQRTCPAGMEKRNNRCHQSQTVNLPHRRSPRRRAKPLARRRSCRVSLEALPSVRNISSLTAGCSLARVPGPTS